MSTPARPTPRWIGLRRVFAPLVLGLVLGLVPCAHGAVAISPGIAVSADPDEACPNAARARISHDRGATWQAGPCLPGYPYWTLDPTPAGAVTALSSGEVVRINPDASVTALLPGGEGILASAAVGSPDGQGSVAILRSAVIGAQWRLSRLGPGGWTECPTQPAIPQTGNYLQMWRSGNIVVAGSAFEPGSPLWVSRDLCASWSQGQLPPGARLSSDPLGTAGQLYAGESGAGSDLLVSRDGGRTWAAADAAFATDAWAALDAGERRFTLLDQALERRGYPGAWRTGGRAVTPPPAQQASLYEFINSRYRRPMGLPDLSFDPKLARAAANHANYWVRNGVGPGLEAHTETPGKPGFTGVSSADRCLAAGGSGCGEVAYRAIRLDAAIRGWLGTPFHGLPLVMAERMGFGESTAGSVGNNDGVVGQSILDLDAAANTPEAGVRLWPADGMTKVAVSWTGGETPDPLEKYTGDRNNVGPVLFAHSFYPADVTLRGPAGPVPLLMPSTRSAAPSLHLEAGGWTAFFAARRLTPGTRYTMTAVVNGRASGVAFTTDGATPRPTRCRVRVRASKLGRAAIVRRGSCRGARVQMRVGKRWVALRPGKRLRVGTTRWRVRQGTRTIQAGRVVVHRPPVRARR